MQGGKANFFEKIFFLPPVKPAKTQENRRECAAATSLTEGPSPALHIAPVLFHKGLGELLRRNAIAHGRAGQVHIYVAELLHKMGAGFGTIQDGPVALLLDDLRRLPGLGRGATADGCAPALGIVRPSGRSIFPGAPPASAAWRKSSGHPWALASLCCHQPTASEVVSCSMRCHSSS